MTYHPFHMVNPSPWPILSAFSSMYLTSGLILIFNKKAPFLFFLGLFSILMIMYQWWRDITRESTYLGYHTSQVLNGMKTGMILFIISEILFFFSFFWTYFHGMLAPDLDLGLNWPPKGVNMFNPFQIPLLNTIILLSSGISITWTHHMIIKNNKTQSTLSLLITITLGIYFTTLQMFEYYMSSFSMTDSMFGSIFFMATGFHGLHVLIGTTFLFFTLLRMNRYHLNSNHHFGFEASAWYWHFVDVVWLFLYLFMYWWIFK